MIDSIRRGVVVVVILPRLSTHPRPVECELTPAKNEKKTGRAQAILLFAPTRLSPCCSSRSFCSGRALWTQTDTSIDLNQRKRIVKKKENFSPFFSLSLSPSTSSQTREKEEANGDFDIFFRSVLSLCRLSTRCLLHNARRLMTSLIPIIKFEVETSQTKATDKEIACRV